MRVLYLFFLLPLSAFASCPAGISLSNLPMGTVLPYCVKWESSTLGGCSVDCQDVCVELPANGTIGPMQTTGEECKLAGGGDTGGGDTGGGDSPYYYPFKNQASPVRTGGEYQEFTTSAIHQLDSDLRWAAIKMYGQGERTIITLKDFGAGLMEVSDALAVSKNTNGEMAKTNHDILDSVVRSGNTLQRLANCVVNPLANDCGHLAGSGGGSGSGDFSFLQPMMAQGLSYMSDSKGKLSSLDASSLASNRSFSDISGTLKSIYSSNSSQLGNMLDSLANINGTTKQALSKGWGGSSGGEGLQLDYSKMPGSSGNPSIVKGAEYRSFCQVENCYFDVARLDGEYKDKQTELTDKYDEIGKDVKDIFDFTLSGSAGVLECFDLFSYGGTEYQVCPPSGEYWKTLASIMMFIFCIIGLMIIFRR
ncbi:hypothetical protein [Aeromonas sobria]|uniref:hypothetical protein n=1 Tax=Aeromonas sobria TaxID=646 RepID=UPI003D085363